MVLEHFSERTGWFEVAIEVAVVAIEPVDVALEVVDIEHLSE